MKLILIICLWIGFSITAIVLKAMRITDVDWWIALLPLLSIPVVLFLMWAYVRAENTYRKKKTPIRKQFYDDVFRNIN